MIDKQQLKEKFIGFFQKEPRLFRAPGRVNLIGEHTDYNGGFVLPMAIDKETAAAIALRNDRKIRVHSVNLTETAEFDLEKPNDKNTCFWLNYIGGAARILERNNFKLSGADILIWSDVPAGAGLSSSAALETVAALSLSKTSGYDIDKTLLAQIGQQTEHEFVGVKVGIMDQFVSANAIKNHALLLDCRSLKFEHIPLDLSEHEIVICNTNIKHDLATSEYNTRRDECEKAVEILQKFLPEIKQLRDVGLKDFEKYENELPEILLRRARHIITENERTLQAADALKNNDFDNFGKLMFASHESLKNHFKVSCCELDLLVEIAAVCKGVLGARMTGGGFGGSTVNFVKSQNLFEFQKKIRSNYYEKTKIEPTILISKASDGACEYSIR
ncbi:galactokinase [soil metagenome]